MRISPQSRQAMVHLLIALNVLAFALEAAGPTSLIDRFGLWPLRSATANVPSFHIWQLLTYSVLHANLAHLAFNMLGLVVFGSEVERVIGARKILKLYATSVACGGIAQVLTALMLAGDAYPAIGASAGVFGVLVAYALSLSTPAGSPSVPAHSDARLALSHQLCATRTAAGRIARSAGGCAFRAPRWHGRCRRADRLLVSQDATRYG
jgi:hypothetical protein